MATIATANDGAAHAHDEQHHGDGGAEKNGEDDVHGDRQHCDQHDHEQVEYERSPLSARTCVDALNELGRPWVEMLDGDHHDHGG